MLISLSALRCAICTSLVISTTLLVAACSSTGSISTIPEGKGQVNFSTLGLPPGVTPQITVQPENEPSTVPYAFTSGQYLEPGAYRFLLSGVKSEEGTEFGIQDVNITVFFPDAGSIIVEVTEGERVNLTVRFAEKSISGAAVSFSDADFEQAVKESLGIDGTTITQADMATLTVLDVTKFGPRATSLEGIQFATNLQILYLGGTEVTDLTPLSGLTALIALYVWKHDENAKVTDVSPLAPLVNLEYLGLGKNSITDFSALEGMTVMRVLDLSDQAVQAVTNIPFLADMEQLEVLRFRLNAIEDLSPLAGLTKLVRLDITGHNFSDITPLANLTNLRTLYLCCNDLTDISPLADLTRLEDLQIHENLLTDISVLEPLMELQTVYLTNNCLDFSPGSPDQQVVETLIGRGVDVIEEGQWTGRCT